MQEYRDDVLHYGGHKITEADKLEVLKTVRIILRTKGDETLDAIKAIKLSDDRSTVVTILSKVETEFLNQCSTLMRVYKNIIGMDDRIFKEGEMDTKRFIEKTDAFSKRCREVLKDIEAEKERVMEAFEYREAEKERAVEAFEYRDDAFENLFKSLRNEIDDLLNFFV